MTTELRFPVTRGTFIWYGQQVEVTARCPEIDPSFTSIDRLRGIPALAGTSHRHIVVLGYMGPYIVEDSRGERILQRRNYSGRQVNALEREVGFFSAVYRVLKGWPKK
tara:strand:+ start:1592 stop:1915 length:324 start_codon:yes stop_codon:yes gene_type:complete